MQPRCRLQTAAPAPPLFIGLRRSEMNIVPLHINTPDPGSSLDYALRYAALGWFVFPVWGAKDGKCQCRRICKSPAKHPVEHLVPRGQDDATTDETTIRRWYASMPDAGVAIFLRPSGMVAIDIDPRNGGFETMDDIEAKNGKLVSDVLQFTQAGGEHRIFKVPEGTNLPGKLGHGVDVKLNGYVVAAPTRGISGVYEWEASSDPLDGAIPSPLPDWLRNLSTVAPAAVECTVASRYVTHAQIGELRDALQVIPADDRDLWVRFGMALCPLGQGGFDLWDEWSKKSHKYDPVDLIRVWRSFTPGQFNFESIFWLAQENGWVNPLSGGAPAPVAVESVVILPPPFVAETPDALLNPPGIVGEAARWINATSRKPQPQFAVQAALAFAATVLGRRYVTEQRNWSSLFFLNVGKSASGKEHGKWAVEKLLESCGLDKLIGPNGYTSDSGVLSTLNKQPTHFACIDEFGKVLEGAAVKNNFRASSMLRTLMEVWGRGDGALRPQGYSTFGMSDADAKKIQERTVRNPAITLLAMTTPESFFDAIGSAAARDGFLNRFIIVESDIGRQVGQASASRDVPEVIKSWVTSVRDAAGVQLINPDSAPNENVTPITVPIRQEAMRLFSAFEHECVSLMDQYEQAGLAEMFGRCNEMAMKLSLILSVGCGLSAVDATNAKWAIDYIRHYSLRTVNRLATCVADSEFEAVKQNVFAAIKAAGANGLAEWELEKRSSAFRKLDQRGQINALNSLAFVRKIQRVEIAKIRGRKRAAWVAIINQEEIEE